MKIEQKKQLYDLLNALCENVISDSQFNQLEEWLQSDQEVRDIYVEFMGIWTDLNYFQASVYSQVEPRDLSPRQDLSAFESLTDSAIWEALSRAENESPVLHISEKAEKPQREIIQKVEHVKIQRHISKFSIFSLIVSAAAVLFLVLFIKFVPDRGELEVASIADSIGPEWVKGSSSLQNGSRLSVVDGPLALSQGFVMLVFDNHATVTIESPAEFTVVAKDQIQLKRGRLYAVVPPEAIGFEVVTPELKVIDLGTEFGVQVNNEDGSAELHVIKGKTTLIAPGNDEKRSVTIHSGSAKKVQMVGLTSQMSDIECDKYKFARHINSANHDSIWRGQETIGINCGDGPSYTAADGTVYMKDTWYNTKSEYPQVNAANRNIGVPDGILYETNRYAKEFTYNIPVANGEYEVTLMFAENHFEEDNQRIFDVLIEGHEVLSNFNIFKSAGGQNIPYKQTFNVTVQDRMLTIFLRANLNNAQINAIKIVPVNW